MIGLNLNMRHLKTLAVAALVGAGAAIGAAPSAQAQSIFWDWGGSQTVGGAGKQTVKFPSSFRPGELVVSFGDRRLYHVTGPGVASAYPIAIPREQSRWQGVTSVTSKRENPSWTPTPTMRAENPRLPMWVPGGHPMNPLGVRALYLGSSAYRIHGTDAPWTIGSAVSKGCVRMYNQDVLDLYPRVNAGAKVTVTWQKFPTGVAMAATELDVTQASAPKKTYLRPVQARRAVRAATQGE
jgi:lipoprotein-anchoring transpeptidase ErfK/SrfK